MDCRESVALVLEDTDLGRWALTHALEARGYEVHAPWTWAEASVWLHRAKVCLALVAVTSPGQAAEVTAEVNWYPHTHLVLLAEEDQVADLRLACGPGPDILSKPFNLGEVDRIALSCQGLDDEARGA